MTLTKGNKIVNYLSIINFLVLIATEISSESLLNGELADFETENERK